MKSGKKIAKRQDIQLKLKLSAIYDHLVNFFEFLFKLFILIHVCRSKRDGINLCYNVINILLKWASGVKHKPLL